MNKCPGQDSRKLRASVHLCPECGHEVEMFSDEFKRRCPKCKATVHREKVPSCIEWCKAAKECLGEERWRQIVGADE